MLTSIPIPMHLEDGIEFETLKLNPGWAQWPSGIARRAQR